MCEVEGREVEAVAWGKFAVELEAIEGERD